jgi:putative hydrolase of HD superfamily
MISPTWIRDLLQLKRTPRAGWFRTGVSRPESVADHCFSMALLAWQLAREIGGLDERKVLLMVLLHDFHEARLTDIPNPAKSYLPPEAVDHAEHRILQEQWPEDEEPRSLIEEFRTGSTEEAELARAVDNLEFLYQAAAYRKAGNLLTEEMLRRARQGAAWGHPVTKPLVEEILEELALNPEG